MTIQTEIKILMTVPDLRRDSGGPAKSVPALAHALSDCGLNVSLFALDTGEHLSIDNQGELLFDLSLCQTGGSLVERSRALRCLSDSLGAEINRPKKVIFHNHGIWTSVNYLSSRIARKNCVPMIISPRGMLEPWALNFKKLKKKVAWYLYQKRDLESACVLHATAKQEALNLRALGLKNPIAVIPNGLELPPKNECVKAGDRIRKVLFLSRIHPVKGLRNLVEAWKDVHVNGWKIVVAGPDECGHKKEILELVSSAGMTDLFEFHGAAYGQNKWDLIRSADIFALPSFSENFGIVIAEALACCIPVITTNATPWSDLLSHRCGWWIDVGVQPLSEALKEAMTMTDQERFEMGNRGRRLVESSYSWDKIAADMALVYKWVLEGGEPPSNVLMD